MLTDKSAMLLFFGDYIIAFSLLCLIFSTFCLFTIAIGRTANRRESTEVGILFQEEFDFLPERREKMRKVGMNIF